MKTLPLQFLQALARIAIVLSTLDRFAIAGSFNYNSCQIREISITFVILKINLSSQQIQ